MTVRVHVASLVRNRAAGRCEYCKMAQFLQGATFHVEHIIPRIHGGSSDAENLALACPGCNLYKSSHLDAFDLLTQERCAIFHPRTDAWAEHFCWDGTTLMGQTPLGRATLALLRLNHPRRLKIREAEGHFDSFPPDRSA
jgi:hypothetical protein